MTKPKSIEGVKAPSKVMPSAVIMLKHFVLSLKMPGQSAHITSYYPEGKKIYSPDTIQHLIDNNAPILAIPLP